tara:strand:- start:213 stop:611 length:399 start_codon:yes stop_codon:yes gene_type:complete
MDTEGYYPWSGNNAFMLNQLRELVRINNELNDILDNLGVNDRNAQQHNPMPRIEIDWNTIEQTVGRMGIVMLVYSTKEYNRWLTALRDDTLGDRRRRFRRGDFRDTEHGRGNPYKLRKKRRLDEKEHDKIKF